MRWRSRQRLCHQQVRVLATQEGTARGRRIVQACCVLCSHAKYAPTPYDRWIDRNWENQSQHQFLRALEESNANAGGQVETAELDSLWKENLKMTGKRVNWELAAFSLAAASDINFLY